MILLAVDYLYYLNMIKGRYNNAIQKVTKGCKAKKCMAESPAKCTTGYEH
jgi:hypothetical protein